jgi:hypothetical protein
MPTKSGVALLLIHGFPDKGAASAPSTGAPGVLSDRAVAPDFAEAGIETLA